MTPHFNTKDPQAREAVMGMLRDGIATPSECARLAGVSRQLVNYWIDAEKIDPNHIRGTRLAKEWRKRIRKKG